MGFYLGLVLLGERLDEGRTFDADGILAVLLVAFAVAKAVQIVDARLTRWLPSTARAE